jgi:hypothetical protein
MGKEGNVEKAIRKTEFSAVIIEWRGKEKKVSAEG